MTFRILFISVAALILAACGDNTPTSGTTDDGATVSAEDAAADMADEVPPRLATINWDEWGVPHIEADDTEGLFYGLGWAHMQLHGDLILELYGRARGRAAEYWGVDFIERDQLTHTMGIPARTAQWWDEQGEEYQAYLTAYAAGMNAYAEAHPEAIADNREQVLPVLPTDPLGHAQWAIHLTFVARTAEGDVANWEAAQRAANIPSGEDDGEDEDGAEDRGSNAWAVAPSRSESGNAMLLANPHLPWFDLFYFTEAQLTGPDLDVYGVTLVGMPFLAIAFNEHLGWTHTVNTFDGMDLYELELGPNGGYMLDGEEVAFDTHEATFAVLEGDGDMHDETITVAQSVFGPVVAQEGTRALAMRVAGLERARLIPQYVAMARATNLDEFTEALSQLQMPMFNTVYADANGDIAYFFNAAMPERGHGDTGFWAGIVPGTTSENLWTGYHDFAELPQYRNPDSGFVQNANDPPWTSTFPQAIEADDYPAYFAPEGMDFRPQHSMRLMLQDEEISFGELVAYANDTSSEVAFRILPELVPLLLERGHDRLNEAGRILEAWDGQTLADSRGAVLFHNWVVAMNYGRSIFAERWSPDAILGTPRGLADEDAAIRAMHEVIAAMDQAGQPLDVTWGEARRIIYGPHNLPSSAGSGLIGSFRVGGWRGTGEPGVMANVAGNSYVAAIEFGERVQAVGYLAYGNSSQPGDPRMGDQVPLYSEGGWRDIHFYADDIAPHTVETEELPY